MRNSQRPERTRRRTRATQRPKPRRRVTAIADMKLAEQREPNTKRRARPKEEAAKHETHEMTSIPEAVYDALANRQHMTLQEIYNEVVERIGYRTERSVRQAVNALAREGFLVGERQHGEDVAGYDALRKLWRWTGPSYPAGKSSRRGKLDDRRDEAADMYRHGKTMQEIGDHFEISRERVRQWLAMKGVFGRTLIFDELEDLKRRVEALEKQT